MKSGNKLICCHAVAPRWLDDAKECIQSGWSRQRDCWSLAHERAAFLENYLAVSTLILNGSSIECHKKKHQTFSLSGVRFGNREIQISGWRSAWRWSGREWAFDPWLLNCIVLYCIALHCIALYCIVLYCIVLFLITCSNSQRKTHQIAQIRPFEPQKWCNE